jgi:hypothetical protein
MPETAGQGRKIKQEKVVQALKAGNTRRAAAGYAGIHLDTFYEWLKNPKFSDSVMEAESAAEVMCATTIVNAARNGDWRAADKWLSKRRRDDWADEINVRDLSIDQLLALARASAGAAGQPEDRMAPAGRNGGRDSDPVP